MNMMEFPELIERASRGDAEAAEWLIENFGPEIRREAEFLLRQNLISRKVEASDIYQSVMRRMFVGLYANQFDASAPEDLRRLLKRMVKNRVTDAARHWTSQARNLRLEVDASPSAPRDPIAAQSTASEIAMRQELVEQYERRLSPQDREILALRRQKVGWAEIASKVGSGNPEALRKRVERLIERFCQDWELQS
jgi:RNA polymerase sigma factor (sigma-70 family)